MKYKYQNWESGLKTPPGHSEVLGDYIFFQPRPLKQYAVVVVVTQIMIMSAPLYVGLGLKLSLGGLRLRLGLQMSN